MASGFTVADMLNRESRAGMKESPGARFRTRDISIFKMYRNSLNFYKVEDIEELAGDILMHGLKQNLELVYEPCEAGEYRIVSGERRWEALKLLYQKGYKEFETATCKLTSPQDADEEQVEVISANAYRAKSTADLIEEERRLKASLERLRAQGRKIKGYDLDSGRLRDVIASMLGISRTKAAQIESVGNHLIPEFQEEMKKGRITFSAAYELSGMDEERQREALAAYGEAGELTHKDVKAMKGREAGAGKDGKAAGQQDPGQRTPGEQVPPGPGKASESGTGEAAPYETPHPEGITSICYSCTEYGTCHVKTGTCTKCDQYRNREEAYKTEEQRYSEEQDRIDRETEKKLREMQQDEKMRSLPSASQGSGPKIHQIRLSAQYFEDVCSGKKNFELRKNDRGYKIGDILEMMEYKDGRNTGRMARAEVTYLLEDYTGLEEGYCIMAVKIMYICGIDMAADRGEAQGCEEEV